MTTERRVEIDEQNPWPGLESFDETAERFFNGRDNQAAELQRLVLQAPLSVLFGASGLGKTSLLRAGLFPLLRKRSVLPVYLRLDVRERNAPLIRQAQRAFQDEIARQRVEAPEFAPDESLWEYLHRRGLELWSSRNQLLRPLFVFDQFEELFTLGSDNQPAVTRFRVDLADLIENRIPASLAGSTGNSDTAYDVDSQQYRVLLSFREDFLPTIEGWKRDLPAIMRNRLRLLPMSGDEAFQAVHRTAPHLVNEDLGRKIVRFVANAEEQPAFAGAYVEPTVDDLTVEPALLSLLCNELNERRKAQGKAAMDDALLTGAAKSIIAGYYRNAVRDMPGNVRRFIEKELITERGFRKPSDVDDARRLHGITDRQLQSLVARRLVRIEPHHETERVELIHDLLTGVVKEEREKVRNRRQRIRVAVFATLSFVMAGFAVFLVWLFLAARNARVAAETANRQLAKASADLVNERDELRSTQSKLTGALTQAEQSAKSEIEQREIARRQAELALARQLVAQSELARSADLAGIERSALLAIEAMERLRREGVRSVDADVAMRQALAFIPRRAVAPATAGPVESVTFAPDGHLVHVGKDWMDGRTRVVRNRPDKVALSPDGRFLAGVLSGREYEAEVWNLTSAQRIGEPFPFQGDGTSQAVLSPGGRLLAVKTYDGSTRVWEVSSRRELTPLPRLSPLAFSSDGKYLAVAGIRTGLFEVIENGGALSLQPVRSIEPRTSFMAAFSPDGRYLARDIGGERIEVLELGAQVRKVKDLPVDAGPTALAISQGARYIAAAFYQRGLEVRDVNDGAAALLPTSLYDYRALAFSPSTSELAVAGPGSGSGGLELWTMHSGTEYARVESSAVAAALNPDENRLSMIQAVSDGRILHRLWNVTHGRATRESEREYPAVAHALSADGRRLAVADREGNAQVRRIDDGQMVRFTFPGEPQVISLAPDGRLLAMAGGNNARLWNVDTGSEISSCAIPGAPQRIAIAEAGSYLHAVEIRILNPRTRGERRQEVDHFWNLERCREVKIENVPATIRQRWDSIVSADGRYFARPGDGDSVRVWQSAGGGEIARIAAGGGKPLAISPRGKFLVTGGPGEFVRLWVLEPADLVREGCARLSRNLSEAEWRELVGPDIAYNATCPGLAPDGSKRSGSARRQ